MGERPFHALARVAAGSATLLAFVTGCAAADPEQADGGPTLRIVVVGDSLSTGYGTSPDSAWPVLLQSVALPDDRTVRVTNVAENGSGYVVAGEYGHAFSDEVRAAVGPTTDVVVFFGSDNDLGEDPETIRDAAASTFAEASELAPNAVLVAVGPLSATEEPDPLLAEVRDAAASAAEDEDVPFIDPIADEWLGGQADVLLGPDGEHPSIAGQELLRDKMEDVLSFAEHD